MRRYETTFILTPDLEETELEKNIERYKNIITTGSGTIEKEDRWGIRRLAYEIQKKTQGYYVHLVHNSEHTVPKELERQFLLNENCLRYLTVVAPPPPPEPEAEVTAVAATTETDTETPSAPTEETPAETTGETTETAPSEETSDKVDEKPSA